MQENFATVLETVADVRAGRTVVTQGDRSRTWRELDDRASRLAAFLARCGVGAEDRVAVALYNGIEYLESVFAVLKLRAIPVNVNYRYRAEEMLHLLSDAHVVAVVFDASLAARVTQARARAPAVRTLVQVSTVSGPAAAASGPAAAASGPAAAASGPAGAASGPAGAASGPAAAASGPAGAAAEAAPGEGVDAEPPADYERAIAGISPLPRVQRGVDHWLMYTGGTTGTPKGVLVTHAWLYPVVCANSFRLIGEPVPGSLDELRAATQRLSERGDAMVTLPAPPLMHATGMYTTLGALVASGRVVFLASRSYDPDELAAAVSAQRVDTVSIVGDVFALPLADALDQAARAGRGYDLSSLRRILSVGVTWSADVKRRLLAHGDFVCRDLIAASEGGPFAISETRRGENAVTSRFTLMPGARVIDDEGHDVVPGSGQVGMLAAPADDQIGYLGDQEKTKETFRIFDGKRWVVTGDLATVEADGSLTFRGRGSRVINTGGEKVFAEEVEQVLIEHPAVRDALVVGLPDQRWGHRVAAVVAPSGDGEVTAEELVAYVEQRLAGYKKPRSIVFVPEVRRTPSGKADLRWAQSAAADSVHQAG